MFLKMFKTVPKTEIKIFTQGPKVWRLEVHRQKSRKNIKLKFMIAYILFKINSIDCWKTLGLLLYEGYLVLGCWKIKKIENSDPWGPSRGPQKSRNEEK